MELPRNNETLMMLVRELNPMVICLQETNLREADLPNFPGYSLYRNDYTSGARACGGVANLVRRDVYSEERSHDNTDIQIIITTVYVPDKINVCNIYLPPSQNISKEALQEIIEQLPVPFILAGDFNAHNCLWGSDYNSPRGRYVEDIIISENIFLLNNGEATHVSANSGTFSAIDLTICSPEISMILDWDVYQDLCGSDHFPITIRIVNQTPEQTAKRCWALKRANWELYSQLAKFDMAEIHNVDEYNRLITDGILTAAEQAIPKTKGNSRRNATPWWNEDCKKARNERRRALRRLKNNPSQENLENFRISRSKARETVRTAKKISWQNFLETLTRTTPPTVVWKNIKKIAGKKYEIPPPTLKVADEVITYPADVANAFASIFATCSSNENYSTEFNAYRMEEERRNPIVFSSNTSEYYNSPFSMWELDTALRNVRNSAPGLDTIHYQMLTHLPYISKSCLLKFFNYIWQSGTFPNAWRRAVVIPILKPGKDKSDASSYRPITLTSCLCKTMERMVNRRLIWHLEKNELLSKLQFGFRKNHSTTDGIITLEHILQNSYLRRQHTGTIFFDLQRAYDTAWRYKILKQLGQWGINGNLPLFIQGFLQDRTSQVRVCTTLSDSYVQENGVPQGSVVSVTLFAIAINDIVCAVNGPVQPLLYVDDLALACTAKELPTVQEQLQTAVSDLEQWSKRNGFTFSPTKSAIVHFHRCRLPQPTLNVEMYNNRIPNKDKIKFLGVTFDQRLSWLPHLKDLRARCVKTMNMLKVVSGTKWGADRKNLLTFYRAYVRSKIDYGSIVYSSARPSYIKMLNPVHNAGIRQAIGALKSSPVHSLYAEAAEAPLETRRQCLLGNYASKLAALPEHAAYKAFFETTYLESYKRRPRSTKPAGIRFQLLCEENSISLADTLPFEWGNYAPWVNKKPKLDLTLTKYDKKNTLPCLYQTTFKQLLREKYPNYVQIYTDGSKAENTVGCAFVVNGDTKKYKLDERCSVFTAEIMAIEQALLFINHDPRDAFVLCSDSYSAITAIYQGFMCDHPSAQNARNICHNILVKNKKVVLLWVPGHVGIAGNAQADDAAKKALISGMEITKIPTGDLKKYLQAVIKQIWYRDWREQPLSNKLRQIKNEPVQWQTSDRGSRHEEVVLTRLRIGHSKLSHAHLFTRQPPRMCGECQVPVTIRHILLDCSMYEGQRRVSGIASNIEAMLGNNESENMKVLAYLRAIRMYDKI